MLPFIGTILDAIQFSAFPLEWRVQDIRASIPIFQPLSCISLRMTLRLLGLLASCILLVF